MPRRSNIEGCNTGDQFDHFRGVRDDVDLGYQHLAGDRRLNSCRRPEHVGQAIGQRSELQELEQALDLGGIWRDLQRIEVDRIEWRVKTQDHQFKVLARSRLVLDQRLTELRRLRVDVGKDSVESTVRIDQLGSGLLAHAWHAGKIVTGVASQGGVLRIHPRLDPGLLLDPCFVVEGIVAHAALVVEHLDLRVTHQLVTVTITGDDHHVLASIDEYFARRRNQVVCFPSGRINLLDPDRVEHLANQTHLLTQNVGGLLALRLVFGLGQVSERGLRSVERHQNAVGSLILDHIDQHRRKAEHSVGDLTAGGRHVSR